MRLIKIPNLESFFFPQKFSLFTSHGTLWTISAHMHPFSPNTGRWQQQINKKNLTKSPQNYYYSFLNVQQILPFLPWDHIFLPLNLLLRHFFSTLTVFPLPHHLCSWPPSVPFTSISTPPSLPCQPPSFQLPVLCQTSLRLY